MILTVVNSFNPLCYLVFVTHLSALISNITSSYSIVITDDEGKKLPEIIGPVDEGSHLSLICETDGDAPSVVTWWKGSYLLDDSFVTMPEGIVRNRLTVSSLHRNDYMAAFTCQAALPNITRPSQTSVSVDLNMRPLDVHIISLQRPVSANRETLLVCQSRGSKPAAILTWWLGSKQLMNTQNTSHINISASTLLFIPKIEDHQRVLSCRASNPVLNGRILEDHWILNIFYIPQLVVTMGTPESNIKEGDDVYFDCNIQANPPVTEVQWRFNGKTIYSDLAAGIRMHNQSLLLRQVTKGSTGFYSCVAANVEGEGSSQNVYLDVHYLPYCHTGQQLSYGAPLKQPISVSCSVDANPSNVAFEWYINTTITQLQLKNFISNGTWSSITYIPKRKTDYGFLFCRARNTVGVQHEPCCYKISPANAPSTVENCMVNNETISSIVIICEAGFDGGLPQEFHLELYSTKGLHTTIANQKIPVFELAALPSGISYIAVVFSTNKYGRSNSVSLTAHTLFHPGEKEGTKSVLISPILGTLIVIVGSLVLVAIIIVIGVRHQDIYVRPGRSRETPHTPVYPYELRPSAGELKPGQYI